MHLFCMPLRRAVGRLAVAVLAAISLAGPALADQARPTVAPQALRDALNAAWRNHPSYRATEARLAASHARLDAAGRPLYNPEIEFSVDDQGPERTTTGGVNLTLDVHGKRRVRQDAASARVDQVSAEARVRRSDFARQWFAGWAELQTAQQRVRTGERRLALVARFAGLADKQFAADDISGLERDLALLARDEAQAEQSALIAERAEAEAKFRAVGGSPELVGGLTLPTGTLLPPVTAGSSIEQLPEWQAAQAAALVAEREVMVAQRNRKADPTIGLRAGRIEYDGMKDQVFGVTASVPLFVRNSYRAEVAAARADVDVAVAETARVRVELDAERRRALESYTAAQAAWSRWQASRGTDIERRTNLLERLWREGELSTSDYLLQLRQTLDTALAGADLEARVWRSYADYLASTGQLERWAGLEGTP